MAKLDCVLVLNQLALDLVAADFSDAHTPTQGGPTRTSRALAMIHLAIHDAYAILTGKLKAKLKSPPAKPTGIPSNDENTALAMGSATFALCRELYPDELPRINAAAADYRQVFAPTAPARTPADDFGEAVAAAWILERTDDGSNASAKYVPTNEPGGHRPDPHHPNQGYLGASWGKVRPFFLKSVVQDAPLGPPPPLSSVRYAKSFDQVAALGRDDTPLKGEKFREQAVIGIFWGYDGSNKLGTPPRLYNQVVRAIVEKAALDGKALTVEQNVILFASINAAMADAGIAAWHWKYTYSLWRPVLGIREADKGWGPSGKGDGNKFRKEKGNPFWCPLGAPKTNSDVRGGISPETENFTPNFPAYPSGHSTFGTACFEVVAAFFGKKPSDIKASFVSDEFNGINADHRGIIRPRMVRTFSLKEAIEENQISRIFLGVHWDFDATGGNDVGSAVARQISTAFGFKSVMAKRTKI